MKILRLFKAIKIGIKTVLFSVIAGLGFCGFLKQRYLADLVELYHDNKTEESLVYHSRIEIKEIILWQGYL